MIEPPGFRGVAFTTAAEGDLRHRVEARHALARRLAIPGSWATVHQVHGGRVRQATGPGPAGQGDALYTDRAGLPLAVFTADCLAIVLEGEGGTGIAHAGWRGLKAGVIERLRSAMENHGLEVLRAAIGPGIGPCCFEVGEEVARRFPGSTAETTWGAASIDLRAAASAQLAGLEVWRAEECTRCNPSFLSYRRNGTDERMAGITWLR